MSRTRTISIALAAVALAATSASFALGRVTEHRQPQISGALPTINGIALAESAERVLAKNMTAGLSPELSLNKVERAKVLALSRRAYASEPLSATAVRNIGLIAADDGQTSRARALLHKAAQLSRRDLSTNVWLIRDYSKRGEIESALTAFNHTLSTSSAGQEMLLPAMFSMLDRRELVEPLVALLRNEPPWAERFWLEAVNHPPALANVARIRVALAADGLRGDDDRNLALLRALTAVRELAVAEALFYAITQSPRNPEELLRNPDFSRPSRFDPFDWRLFFDTFIAADILPAAGTMRIETFSDGSGPLARQLVSLKPGLYALSIEAREWDALDVGALEAELHCAEANGGAASGSISITRPDFITHITVPDEGCGYYWLKLRARAQPQRKDNTVILDSIRLRRAS